MRKQAEQGGKGGADYSFGRFDADFSVAMVLVRHTNHSRVL